MKRQNKFPETPHFIWHNQNPKGRITGDCVFRAFSLGLDEDYNELVMEMAKSMVETGYALNDKKGERRFLEKKGWVKHKQPRHDDNTKMTGKEFCTWLSINYPKAEIGNVICHIGTHHMVCIKPTYHGEGFNCRYKVHDTWNSSGGAVGVWWTKG